jgi:hypothetical protein
MFEGSRVRGFEGSKVRGFEGSKVRGFEGSRVRGFEGSRVRGFEGSRVRGFEGSKVRGFEGSRVRGWWFHTQPPARRADVWWPSRTGCGWELSLGGSYRIRLAAPSCPPELQRRRKLRRSEGGDSACRAVVSEGAKAGARAIRIPPSFVDVISFMSLGSSRSPMHARANAFTAVHP